MSNSWFRSLAARILVLGLVFTLAPSILAQDARQLRVLALYVATPGAAGAASFETVFQKTMGDALGSRLDFQSEFIDLSRYSDPSYPSALVDFLHYKYERLPPDVIIATTEGARQFVERFRPQLFPSTPVVFIDRTASPHVSPGMTGISARLDLAGTVDLALTLQPKTTQVFVVTGKSEFDRRYEQLARQQSGEVRGTRRRHVSVRSGAGRSEGDACAPAA